MKLTIFRKGLFLVCLPLLFQLAFSGLVAHTQREHRRAVDWEIHSTEVIRQCETVMQAMLNCQTGERGFVITADPSFLEARDLALKELPSTLDRLQVLVQDNPVQLSRAERIRAATGRIQAWHNSVVALARQGTQDDAVAAVKSRTGKLQMDAIRREVTSFLAEEERLSNQRHETVERSTVLLGWMFIAGGCTAILSTLILAIAFSRSITRRLAILADNSRRLAQGEELNALVSGGDEIAQLDRSFRDMAAELSRSDGALRKQTQILEAILTSIGDGVVVADCGGNFLVFNPAAEQILGAGRTETQPEQWTEKYGLYQADTITPYAVHDLPLVRAIRGETVDALETYVRHARQPKGAWISFTGRPLKDSSGALLGGVVVFHDVTESKRVETEIRELNEQLEQRVVERTVALEESNRDLSQKNQENEMFVYSVSHDLRSPLVNLQGFSKELAVVCDELRVLVAENPLPVEAKQRALTLLDSDMLDSIRFIQSAVLRLSNIIDSLLRLSRAGKIEYRRQDVDMQGTVARIVEAMGNTSSDRGAALLVHDLPSACGDPAALEQVFANLIGNALNYLDPCRAGQIEIGVLDSLDAQTEGAAPDTITFYVKDNGVGISESQYPKVFQALQRLHPHMAKGEGMGLTMARRIVERHGGHIWFESTVGAGTTFFVSLPTAPARSAPTRESNDAESERRPESCRLNR